MAGQPMQPDCSDIAGLAGGPCSSRIGKLQAWEARPQSLPEGVRGLDATCAVKEWHRGQSAP